MLCSKTIICWAYINYFQTKQNLLGAYVQKVLDNPLPLGAGALVVGLIQWKRIRWVNISENVNFYLYMFVHAKGPQKKAMYGRSSYFLRVQQKYEKETHLKSNQAMNEIESQGISAKRPSWISKPIQ